MYSVCWLLAVALTSNLLRDTDLDECSLDKVTGEKLDDSMALRKASAEASTEAGSEANSPSSATVEQGCSVLKRVVSNQLVIELYWAHQDPSLLLAIHWPDLAWPHLATLSLY